MEFIYNIFNSETEKKREEQVVTPVNYTSDDEWIYVNEKNNVDIDHTTKYSSYADCVKHNLLYSVSLRKKKKINYEAYIKREQALLEQQRAIQCPVIHEEIPYNEIEDLPTFEVDYPYQHGRWVVRRSNSTNAAHRSLKSTGMKTMSSFRHFHLFDRPVQVL